MVDRLLSREERTRFSLWLHQEAHSADEMAKAFEEAGSPTMQMMAKRERQYAIACVIIYQRLDSTEDMTIRPEDADAVPSDS